MLDASGEAVQDETSEHSLMLPKSDKLVDAKRTRQDTGLAQEKEPDDYCVVHPLMYSNSDSKKTQTRV